MFGFGAFGEAAFSAVPGSAVVLSATGALEAQPADLAGDVSPIVVAEGALAAQAAEIAGGVALPPPLEVDGALHAGAAGIGGSAGVDVDAVGALSAQAADIAAFVEARDDANGDLVAGDAVLSGETLPDVDAVGALHAEAAHLVGLARRNMTTLVTWEGEAELEFVSTTDFIDMIESGQARLGLSAEARLRSL